MLSAILLLLLCVGVRTVASVDALADCAQYVTEGASLYCECRAVNVTNIFPVATWPGHSNNYQLHLENVRRTDNGTQYGCQVTAGNETKSTVYTLQVAYGPTDATTTIIIPETFITDGSLNLTLTCEATEVNPVPKFSWSGVTCDEDNYENTCTFQPQPPGDDGKRVSCIATNRMTSPSPTSGMTLSVVNLTYPPTAAPVVSGYLPGQVLKTGDTLLCTVTGGKPPVAGVLFQCSNPKLPDEEDIVNGQSVSSPLTVNTSQATDASANCFCQAVWEPDFKLYRLTTAPDIQIEYKASVLSFSVNDSAEALTANENTAADVNLQCSTHGRPKPNITLHRQGDATTLRQVDQSDVLLFRLSRVACEQMGTYTCTADNGYPDPSQKSVRLIVNCAPKHVNSTFVTSNMESPPTVTSAGLNLTLIAHPVPSSFTFRFHGNQSSNSGRALTRYIFSIVCRAGLEQEYLVVCEVKVYDVAEDDLGVYSVNVANGWGDLDYYLQVEMAVAGKITAPTDDGSGGTAIAAIAGGAAAGVVVVIVVIAVVAVFVVKGRTRKDDGQSEPPQSQRDEVLEEHINIAYVSADEIDKNSSGQSSHRKRSPDSVPLSSARTPSGYDCVSDIPQRNNDETETDFGYASVNGGNVENGLASVNDSETLQQSFETDMYASVDEGEPNTTPERKSTQGGAYAVVEINEVAPKCLGNLVSLNNDYADVDGGGARGVLKDDRHSDEDDGHSSNRDTIVGPLGDVYSQVDRTSKKSKRNPVQATANSVRENTQETTGPLGDVYAEVHKPSKTDASGSQNRQNDGHAPVQKPKRQSNPKRKPKPTGKVRQSGAAAESSQNHNAGTSYEEFSSTAGSPPQPEDCEVDDAASSPTTDGQTLNNGQPDDDHNTLNISEREPPSSGDPCTEYSHIKVGYNQNQGTQARGNNASSSPGGAKV